jgi:cytochrome c556
MLREIGRSKAVGEKPDDFRRKLSEAEAGAGALRQLLVGGEARGQKVDAALARVMGSCVNCHKAYRDRPSQ